MGTAELERPMRGPTGQAGFSLVEVIVALGLLAGILVSVAGMFVLGNRHVASGRNSSEALAVARGMMEEMQGWGFHQTYGLFEEPSCSPASSATCVVDTAENVNAAKWQTMLVAGLGDGSRGEVRFRSLDGVPLATARAIQVRIAVFWSEGDRPRRIEISTVRM